MPRYTCRRLVALSLALFFTATAEPARAAGVTTETVSPVARFDGRVPRVILGGFHFDSQNRPVVSWTLHDPVSSDITTAAYWSRREAGEWNRREFWKFCCLLGTHSHATAVAGGTPWVLFAAPTAFDGYGVFRSNLTAFPDGSSATNTEGTDNYRTPGAQNNVFIPDVASDAASPSYARTIDRQLGVMSADLTTRSIAGREVNRTEFDYVAASGGRHHVLYSPWVGGTSQPETDGIYYWDGTPGTAGVRVPSGSDGRHLRPALGLDRGADGTLHAVVNRPFGELGNLERYLFHYISADGGNTWSETLLAGYLGSGLHTPPGFATQPLQNVIPVEVDVAVDGAGTPWIAYVTLFDDASNPQPNSGGNQSDIGVWLAHSDGGAWMHQRVASFVGDGEPLTDVKLAIDRDGVPTILFHHKGTEELVLGSAANARPTLVNPGDQVGAEGESASLPLVASDPNGDSLTYGATGLPAGLTIDPASGVVSGTLGFDSSGVYVVTVTVNDGLASASASFTWTIANVQDLPVDLNIETHDSPDPVEANGLLRYVVTATNRGATRATGVIVTEQLPNGVSLEQSTPAPTSQAGGTLSFDVGSLAAGATWSATVSVRTGMPGALTHRAEVAALEPEVTPGDNVAVLETRVLAASCFPIDRQGLRGSWHADGDAFDSVSGTTAQLQGGLGFAPGKIGQAFDFDGVDDVVEVADSPSLRVIDTVSIAFWAQRRRYGVEIVLEKGGDWTGGQTNYGVGLHEANDRMFYFFFAGGWRGAASFADPEWHHYAVVATHGEANPRLFIDGVERDVIYGDGAATINLNPSTLPLHIGAQVDGANTYHSQLRLDAVQIYDRALTPAEIAADAAAPQREECDGVNHPPVLAPIPDRTDMEGDDINFQLQWSDPDGDTDVAFTFEPLLPDGVALEPATGRFFGKIGYFAAPTSPGRTIPISVTLTDRNGARNVQTFNWTVVNVNRMPVVANPGPQSSAEGTLVDLRLPISDPDYIQTPGCWAIPYNSFCTFTFTHANLPPGLNVVGVDAGGFMSEARVFGVIDSGAAGHYDVTLSVTDNEGGTTSVSFPWVITSTNRPPVAVSDNAATTVDTPVTIPVLANDSDPDGDALSVALLEQPAHGSVTLDASAAVVYTPAPGFTGNDVFLYHVTDGTSATAVGTVNITVAACVPALPGMISWWRAEGDASDQVDGNDGTLVAGAGFAPGRVGQAFDLSANAHVEVGDPDNLRLGGDLTLTAWVRTNVAPTTADGTWQAVLTKWSQSAATDAYGLWITNTDGTVRAGSAIGVPGVADTGLHRGVVSIGEWTHLATSYDRASGQHVLYVNGVEVGRRSHPGGTTISSAKVLIGREDSGIPRPFRGLIDEPAIYGRALSADEIAALFAAGSAGVCPLPANRPPSLVNPGAQSSVAGEAVRLELAATDPDGDPLTYSATGLPAGLALDPGTGLITGTLALDAAGTYLVTVSVSDGRLSDSASFEWRIQGATPALSIGDVTVVEGNGVSAATFTVTLSPASSLPVSVRFATANGTAVAGLDYVPRRPTTLLFPPGVTTRTITVAIVGGPISEATESFFVNLSGATNAVIADGQGVGTITDDDPLPTLSIGNVTRLEGDRNRGFRFAVWLSAPSGQPVSVDYATVDESATAGSDYQAVAGTLTFPPGSLFRFITVSVAGDTTREPNETFGVVLTKASGASLGDGRARATIVNDDGFRW